MALTSPRRRPARAAVLARAIVALAVLMLYVPPALARPVTLDDLLRQEGVGSAAFDPTGRYLVLERRGPYAAGSRFDLEGFNDLARTTLWVAPVNGASILTPLVPAEPGAGYRLGPLSPDGRWAAVFRLRDDRWRLGVVRLADRHTRWFEIAPELSFSGRALQWRNPSELIVLTTPDGDLPRMLRFRNEAARKLPERWRASREGRGAHTVFGSGRYLGLRPQAPCRRLLRLDVHTGESELLACGDFTDLESSPDGRRLALLEAAEDIRLAADRPLQGDDGLAVRRQRLRLLDLVTGRLSRPAPGLDVLPLLAWAPRGPELLVYARRDGEPWTAGQLLRLEAATGAARPAAPDVVPELDRRPELVRAGWRGGDPLVYGRPRGAPEAPAAAWLRQGARGVEPVSGVSLPAHAGIPTRLDRVPAPAGVAQAGTPPAPNARRLALSSDGDLALDLVPTTGGRQQLRLSRAGGPALPLLDLNVALAEVDAPELRRLDHVGPSGEPLVSWLLLPPRRPGAGPAPLVIVPYLGNLYPNPPAAADWRSPGPIQAAPLLAAKGYAVMIPSLPVRPGAEDPAGDVADRLLALAERVRADPDLSAAVDVDRIALWGVSYGGYTVLSAITQTGRFRAAIALAAPANLISKHGEFHPQWRVDPSDGVEAALSMGWVETDQGAMKVPPWTAPDRYIRNSPALQAQRISTPLLLFHGDQDNILHSQAESMFTALYRQGKDAQLVTYWGEGHVIRSPGNLRDLYGRAFAFLDEHLRPPAGRARLATPEDGRAWAGLAAAEAPSPPGRASRRAVAGRGPAHGTASAAPRPPQPPPPGARGHPGG